MGTPQNVSRSLEGSVDVRRVVTVVNVRGAVRAAWNGTCLASEKAARVTDMVRAP